MTNKKINLIIILASVLLASIIYAYLSYSNLKYNLNLIRKNKIYDCNYTVFHDFNKDGYSEELSIKNDKTEGKHWIQVIGYQSDRIEKVGSQHNLTSDIDLRMIFFADYTGDDYDDIFIFTHDDNHLYLTVINENLKQVILREEIITDFPHINPNSRWDIKIRTDPESILLDVNQDGKKDLVFAIHSGLSTANNWIFVVYHNPRGVYIYDIEQRKLINEYPTNIGIKFLRIFDLTNNGKSNIIFGGWASGNIKDSSKTIIRKDDKSWLFIFDQNLNSIVEPKSFGEYPSNLFCNPVIVNNEPKLILSYNYHGIKKSENFISIIDSNAKVVNQKDLTLLNLSKPLIESKDNKLRIYLSSQNEGIVIYNEYPVIGSYKICGCIIFCPVATSISCIISKS